LCLFLRERDARKPRTKSGQKRRQQRPRIE
jgi:hypothetical protein